MLSRDATWTVHTLKIISSSRNIPWLEINLETINIYMTINSENIDNNILSCIIVSVNHFLCIHLCFQILWPSCRNLLKPERIQISQKKNIKLEKKGPGHGILGTTIFMGQRRLRRNIVEVRFKAQRKPKSTALLLLRWKGKW